MNRELAQDEIKALLEGKTVTHVEATREQAETIYRKAYKNTRNTKHVTWHTESPTMKCSNKWGIRAIECGCPTVIKVNGLPFCSIHAILKLAEMLDPKIEEGEL